MRVYEDTDFDTVFHVIGRALSDSGNGLETSDLTKQQGNQGLGKEEYKPFGSY